MKCIKHIAGSLSGQTVDVGQLNATIAHDSTDDVDQYNLAGTASNESSEATQGNLLAADSTEDVTQGNGLVTISNEDTTNTQSNEVYANEADDIDQDNFTATYAEDTSDTTQANTSVVFGPTDTLD
jgi:hypothetical protein